MTSRRRLAKYRRRKNEARTPHQFTVWSIRYHRLRNRLYGAPNLWSGS